MIKCRKEVEGLRAYVPGKPIDDVKREYGLDTIIKLASNENPLGCSDKVKEAIINSLNESGQYPDGNCTNLRNKLADVHGLSQDQFIFGAGSDEVISMITKTFVSAGDEVIVCAPTFPQYKAGTLQMSGVAVELPLTKEYCFDLDAIAERITDKTKVVFIPNPNNPTGTIITADEQLDFLKKVPEDVLVVMDEAYVEYIKDATYPNSIPLLSQYKNLMVLRTFSKMYGLATFRVGYGIGHPELIGSINKVRNPFNVSTVAQAAAIAALDDNAFVEKAYSENVAAKAYTYEQCDALNLEYIPSYANFVMINFDRPSDEMFLDLQRNGYIVRPGHNLGLPGFQRVSLGTVEQMKGFFETVKQILGK